MIVKGTHGHLILRRKPRIFTNNHYNDGEKDWIYLMLEVPQPQDEAFLKRIESGENKMLVPGEFI